MGTITEAPGRDVLRSIDQRVTLRGLSWSDYERLIATSWAIRRASKSMHRTLLS
jgi:hypothetical protein